MAACRRVFVPALLCLLAVPAATRADEFADFRVPEHRVLLWTGSASGYTSWSGHRFGSRDERQGTGNAQLGSDAYYRHETDSRVLEMKLGALASGSRQHVAVEAGPEDDLVMRSNESKDQRADFSNTLALLGQWYLGGSPIGVLVGVGATFAEGRRWRSSRDQFEYQPPDSRYRDDSHIHDEWGYSRRLSGTLGAELGRVRNATGLYEARVLEERLRTAGALTRRLGPKARRSLAALFYCRPDLSRSTDRPATAVWSLIEDILREDGALSEAGLGGHTLLPAVAPFLGKASAIPPDALPVSPVLRQRGWRLWGGADLSTEQSINRLRYYDSYISAPGDSGVVFRGSLRTTSPSDAIGGSGGAECHWPSGVRWQFDASTVVRWPLKHGPRGFALFSQASETYMVADRWQLRMALTHERRFESDQWQFVQRDSWNVGATSSCDYWLTDHVSLNVAFAQTWDHDHSHYISFYPPSPADRSQHGSLQFGLGYRFAGFTEIPGITSLAR